MSDNDEKKPPIFNDPKTVAGKYGEMFKVRRKRQCDAMPVIKLPPKVIGGLRDQMTKVKNCNCRRSNCLKLYCDCFQAGIFCQSFCNCVNCKNTSTGGMARTQAILVTLDRNPHAFRPRLLSLGINEGSDEARKQSGLNGCNCRKSHCLKKYCECFHASVVCSATHCNCLDCQNVEGNEKREQLMMKRKKSADAAAAATKAAQQHTRLAVEGDETIAAIGVDPFLPPSTYTIPIKMPNGIPLASLAFGSCDHDIVKNPVSVSLSQIPPKSKGFLSSGQDEMAKKPSRATDLEAAWCIEANKAQSMFSAMTKEFKRRKGENVVPNETHTATTRKRAYDMIASTEAELKRLRKSVDNAQQYAQHGDPENEKAPKSKPPPHSTAQNNRVSTDYKLSNNTNDSSMSHKPIDESSLLCHEELPQPKTALSEKAEQELTILLAQDEAMIFIWESSHMRQI